MLVEGGTPPRSYPACRSVSPTCPSTALFPDNVCACIIEQPRRRTTNSLTKRRAHIFIGSGGLKIDLLLQIWFAGVVALSAGGAYSSTNRRDCDTTIWRP